VRKGVDDVPRAFMLAALRHELSRWLTSMDAVSRVLFPENAPDEDGRCPPADPRVERR
jgi:hypothetical protein